MGSHGGKILLYFFHGVYSMMRRCFPPVMDKDTRIIIFGSFPGQESLRKGEYYGHKQNQFWKLIGTCISEELHDQSYQEKLRVLKNHGIGVWDVIRSCEREGSLDSNIRNHKRNDFSRIKRCPKLQRVCFNGKTAAKFYDEFEGFERFVLPSSSPANTICFEEKCAVWKEAVWGDKS